MAVYTDVTDEALFAFLAAYDLGAVLSFKGIAEGVENSNFLLHCEAGYFILTLYEKRVDPDRPALLHRPDGASGREKAVLPAAGQAPRRPALGDLAGRPAAIVTFLDGVSTRKPGRAPLRRNRARAGAIASRRRAISRCRRPMRCRSTLAGPVRGVARRAPKRFPRPRRRDRGRTRRPPAPWPRDLPQGVIHADLFPDNVFFIGEKLSGLIDFYFACNDSLAYDLAICLNAWCFEPDGAFNATKGRALLQGYQSLRPLDERRARRPAGAGARRGHALPADPALRLAERAARRAGEAEEPARISRQAAVPSDASTTPREYGLVE